MSRLRLVLLSMLAVFAVSAVAAATASALEFYNASGVLIQGLLNVAGLGGKSELRGEGSSTLIHISCEKVHTRGWIHNGLVNQVLTGLGLILLLFLECKVLAPVASGCEVEGGKIHVLASALALTINTKAYIDLTPDEPPHFVIIKLENCTNSGLNGSYPVNGTAVGLVNNATSELEFTPGSPNNKLTFAGNPAEIEGNGKVEMEGGGNIEVK